MKPIQKAVIPAAGLGTRFLPATKAIPKEMLTIVDRPTIQYIVEEAIQSGIRDIYIVTGSNKQVIKDHFDRNEKLEFVLNRQNKHELLKLVLEINRLANIHYVTQEQPLGLGHAIWCAHQYIGNEPFAVLLGDIVIDSEVPCLKQLIDVYHEMKSSVVAVEAVDWSETGKFGIIDGTKVRESLYLAADLIEKPGKNAPSNLAIAGRYILEPEIFRLIKQTNAGAGGEIQLTDALQQLAKIRPLWAYQYQGKWFDIGDKLGFVQANVELALKNDQLKGKMLDFLRQIVGTAKTSKNDKLR